MFKGPGGGPQQPPRSAPRRPQVRKPSFTISPATRRMLIAAAVIVILFVALFATAAFWVNWWWFGSMGFRSVLVRRYVAESVVFVIAALATGAIFIANVVIALRRSRAANENSGRLSRYTDRLLVALALGGCLAVAIVIAAQAASQWETWLLWWYSEPFGIKDPVFGRDAGFFIFALPAIRQLVDLLLLLVLVTIVAVVVVYALRLGVNVRQVRDVPALMRVHVLSLAGFVFILIAVLHLLENYELAFSTRGAVFGAGYTDVTAQRPANWALAIAALVIGGLLVANAFVRRLKLLLGAVAAWGVLWVVLGIFVPQAVQQTVVEPSELKRESEYIENNIAMTRVAYGLDTVTERELSGREPVTGEAVEAYPDTLSNIRLWDYRVIRGTYQQLQSFVPYYVFQDVDVDRYWIDGSPQQVLISARELDQNGLPENAQTWTNQRLVYTHGYGAVVSPVVGVSRQGLPLFLVERIPPTGTGVYEITRPEIYFGEADLGWVVVGTEQPEFTGLVELEGAADGSGGYAGAAKGGIKLDNYLTKVLVSAHLRDRNLFLTGNITDESIILMHRNVTDRLERIAPFLRYDADPYLVIADGRLVWIIDAYTTTDRFPHATRIDGINYMRNSVKVTVDAYDGTVTFYRTAEFDPIADAYDRLYGDLFLPISDAPASVAAHFRYPELLFDVQSEIYASVHVTDPTAYYNGEDRWAVPQEQVGGTSQRMVPYYVTLTLPEEMSADFTLIRPFIPGGRSQRQNMTAWMAGRTAPNGDSFLVVYRFPRQETVFGPSQIEARISQEPEISAQISLWNQSGSSVIRGNLLVIPIRQSILYVQPLYLQATSSAGALPELKRVIVASNEQVVMAETLDQALAALTGAEVSIEGQPTDIPSTLPEWENPVVQDLVERSVAAYTRGEQALAAGDWAAYGEAQAELRSLLDQLAVVTGAAPSEPAATPMATPIAE